MPAVTHRIGDALRRPPHGVRLAIVGLIGAAITYAVYEGVHAVLPLENGRAAASWTLAAVFGAFTQHHLHRRITFATKARDYESSLWRALVVEAVAIAFGAGVNFWLTERLGVDHRPAWLAAQLTLFASKYVAMRLFVFRPPGGDAEGAARER